MRHIGVKIVLVLVKIFGRLPLGFHYAMCRFAVWFVKNVARYRRDVVMTNLARSFPEKKYRELEQIADEYYGHLGEIMAETLWFGASDAGRLHDSGIVTLTGRDELYACFENSPSVTVLCSHCGNWELLGGILAYPDGSGKTLGVGENNIRVVYKRLHSAFSDEFFRQNRVAPLVDERTECTIETSDILRYVLKHKNEKKIYAFIADQYPYQTPYDVGEFLHQPTKAMLGSVRLANKCGHSVVYMKMKRLSRGKYEIVFIPLYDNASLASPEEILRKYFDLLEEEIRETPCNWLWSHRRWK